MGINHGGIDVGVPTELLKRGQIATAHKEMGCEAVPERMNRSPLDPGPLVKPLE